MEYSNSKFIESLFDELNKAEIEYFVIGDYTNLPHSTGQRDIDIYIPNKDYNLFIQVFKELLDIYNAKVVSAYSSSNEIQLFRVLGFWQTHWWGIAIDVFKKGFIYEGQVYFPLSEAKKNIICYNGINVLKKDVGYIAGFLKELLFVGKVKDKYNRFFYDQLKHNTEFLESIIAPIYGKKFWYILIESIRSCDGRRYKSEQLSNIVRNSIHKSHFSYLTNKIRKLSNIKRMIKQPGYTLAFLGTDGAGKSTIINRVSPLLKITFNKMIYYEHLRPNYLPSIAELLGKRDKNSDPVDNPHGSGTSGYFGSLVRWTYYMADYILGYLVKIFPKKAIRSCVWLFDRYYYDYLIDPKRLRIKLPKFIIHFGKWIIPEPDLIICLGTDAQKIQMRKPELPLEEINRQVVALKKFSNKNNHAVWVDTGENIEKATNEALQAIFEVMSNRFNNKT